MTKDKTTTDHTHTPDTALETPAPQYRKRVKGFTRLCSWDNGEDEFIQTPDECPNIATGWCGVVEVGGYEGYEVRKVAAY